MINPLSIIEKYYPKGNLRDKLIIHSGLVRDKALEVLLIHPEIEADKEFIETAAMLHDIGIIFTNAPSIGCYGERPYVCHGFLGHDLLISEGLKRYALVCERHTGTGITKEEIINQKLPLPLRDMFPISIEEKIICYADKFFSKGEITKQLSVKEILKNLERYGSNKKEIFLEWYQIFS